MSIVYIVLLSLNILWLSYYIRKKVLLIRKCNELIDTYNIEIPKLGKYYYYIKDNKVRSNRLDNVMLFLSEKGIDMKINFRESYHSREVKKGYQNADRGDWGRFESLNRLRIYEFQNLDVDSIYLTKEDAITARNDKLVKMIEDE